MEPIIEQAERELAYSRHVLTEGFPRKAQQHALAVQGDLIDTVLNADAVDERRTARALYAQARDLAAEATSQLPTSDSRRRTIRSIIADVTPPRSRARDVSHPPTAAMSGAEPEGVSADYGLN